jgi:diaminopimelate epimerase
LFVIGVILAWARIVLQVFRGWFIIMGTYGAERMVMDYLGEYLIAAAGGNVTAIRTIGAREAARWYAGRGEELRRKYAKWGVEQEGFLIVPERHFQMAGGEFCGNATRAVAVIFFEIDGRAEMEYTVSGFCGKVSSAVMRVRDRVYDVTSVFTGMVVGQMDVVLEDGVAVSVVDLGGIVHVLIEGDLPRDYEVRHGLVARELGLLGRPAVGVVWYQRIGGGVRIDPVVWVKDVDTFYRETSCGSGSIAAAKVGGVRRIIQVTGEFIEVEISAGLVSLRSEMEVLHYERLSLI